MTFLRAYLLAIRYFTRVPVAGALGPAETFSADSLRASAGHFPGVGWLAGMLGCSVFAFLGLALPVSPFTPFVAAVGCTIATALLTGAAHETGLAHTADALARDTSTPQARAATAAQLHAAGALALVLALSAKTGLLAVLAASSPAAVLAALLAGHVLSRFWALWVPLGLPYLGDAAEAETGPLGQRIGRPELSIAGSWSALALVVAGVAQGPAFAIAGVLASGGAVLWMRRVLAHRLRGFTRDSVGATQQVCEIACYLGAAVGSSIA